MSMRRGFNVMWTGFTVNKMHILSSVSETGTFQIFPLNWSAILFFVFSEETGWSYGDFYGFLWKISYHVSKNFCIGEILDGCLLLLILPFSWFFFGFAMSTAILLSSFLDYKKNTCINVYILSFLYLNVHVLLEKKMYMCFYMYILQNSHKMTCVH